MFGVDSWRNSDERALERIEASTGSVAGEHVGSYLSTGASLHWPVPLHYHFITSRSSIVFSYSSVVLHEYFSVGVYDAIF